MTFIPLLLDALAVGALRIDYGRIDGYSGYLDPRRRVVILNPEASPDELLESFKIALAKLSLPGTEKQPQTPTVRPVLSLVHSVDEVEHPEERGDPAEAMPAHLQVVG